MLEKIRLRKLDQDREEEAADEKKKAEAHQEKIKAEALNRQIEAMRARLKPKMEL